MSQGAVTLPLVLRMFLLLFSNRWVENWQKRWQRGAQKSPSDSQPKKARGSKKKNQKKTPRQKFYQRIFSLRVTLWHLIFQRLNSDHTHAAVLRDVRQGGADRLGRNGRKLSQRVKSTCTGGYNQARQRMPLELLQEALAFSSQSLLRLAGYETQRKTKPEPLTRPRQLLDGSTLSILMTPLLAKTYAVAEGRWGKSDWCLMRILVGFCARSGAVLSALEGAVSQSEQKLAWALMEKAAAFTIWIADRNFGVWSVVAQALKHNQDAVVRLTQARAGKLANARPLRSGEDRSVQWSPSRHDQCPPDLERKAVCGRLIYLRLRRGFIWIDLYLFTTLDRENYPAELLVQWYGLRWKAELHFRSVKTQMEMAEIKVCSPEMARKEFYASLLAYSLVRAVMWGAGERLETNHEIISFNDAKRVLLDWLKDWGRRIGVGASSAQHWIKALLREVALQTLPKRRKKRPNEPRRVRCRSAKFPTLKGSRHAARVRYCTTKSK